MNALFLNKDNCSHNSSLKKFFLFFQKRLTYSLKSKIFVKKISILIIFLISSFSSIQAQDSPKSKVWIDFIEESDTLYVYGLVANLENQSKEFRTELTIQKIIKGTTESETIQNSRISKPFDPEIFSQAKIDLKKREYFVIQFKVFDQNNNLVGSDILKSTRIDPSLTPPVAQNKVTSQPKLAQNQPLKKKKLPKPKTNLDALEIDGLILDETRSKIGRDFYEIFYNRWTPPVGAKDFLITIKELPSRGIGARVSIQVNDNIVLYRFLQPRSELVEQEANLTISYLKNYLMRNENLKQDLEAGDQMGSGIF